MHNSRGFVHLDCGIEELDRPRLRDVFPLVFRGLLMTRERRRTCTSWFRAGGIDREFRRGYRVICLAGRQTVAMGVSILYDIANSPTVAKQERIKLTLDDTTSQHTICTPLPTNYGRCGYLVRARALQHSKRPK